MDIESSPLDKGLKHLRLWKAGLPEVTEEAEGGYVPECDLVLKDGECQCVAARMKA